MSFKDLNNPQFVLIASALSSFIASFTGSALNIALPAIQEELSADVVLLSWTSTAYLLANAIFLIPSGKIADIYGRRKFLGIGVFLFVLASIGAWMSQDILFLLLMRFLHGIGSAFIFGTNIEMISSVYPAKKLGTALGMNVAGVYSGLSFGPVIGGYLIQFFGWRNLFLAILPFGVVILYLVFGKIKDSPSVLHKDRFDLGGSIIYGIMLTLVFVGLSLIPLLEGILLLLVGSGCALGFVAWEMKNTDPMLDLSLFLTNRRFSFSNLTSFFAYSSTFGLSFLLSLYLQYIKALSPQQAGLIILAQPIIRAIGSPIAGRLSERVAPRILVTFGLCIVGLGLSAFVLFDASTPLLLIVVSLGTIGIGFSLFSSPNSSAIMQSVSDSYYGVASASMGTMRLIGDMISIGISTTILTLLIGRTQIVPANYPVFLHSLDLIAIAYIGCAGIGAIMSFLRGKSD